MQRLVETLPAVHKLPTLTRVAAYARVSSGKDAMLHSLSAQISCYREMILSHPGWSFVGVYSDEAETGTKAQRPGFQNLLTDCRAGKIDLVITKSISRFARNTVTLLEAVRELKTLGVDVFFEEQNIHTMSADGELMLSILASYAQEESRSVSENMKWRVRKNFHEGLPWNCNMLGYRSGDRGLQIVPEEAALVRRIFELYLQGNGQTVIAKIMNEEGAKTLRGFSFTRNGICKILHNYAYTGNLLLQTTVREDHISKRQIPNDGRASMYHAIGTHEAIIDEETFRAVQVELERRAKQHHPKPQANLRTPLSGKITCACCGKHFTRRNASAGPIWICRTFRERGKAYCPTSKQIPEPQLFEALTGIDMESIAEIVAAAGNRLRVRLLDGSTLDRVWRDHSRADSWTPEMREAARIKAKEGVKR